MDMHVKACKRRHEASQDGTLHFDCGFGNYYARLGQLDIWLKQQRDASTDVYELLVDTDEEDDDEEDDS